MAATIPTRLTVVFESHKADKDLGGNSRANWRVIRRKNKANKHIAQILTLGALAEADTFASEFLTHDRQYTIEQALPLKVICRRYYSGPSRQWDSDNLQIFFKGHLDGLSAALSTNDLNFEPVVEQIREKTGHRLELELIPAWSGNERKEGAA